MSYVHDTPLGLDGYGRMEFAEKHNGWRAVSSWGRNGWDLGSWPLITVMRREKDGKHQVRYDVEGDVTITSWDSEADANAYINGLAFFHWQWAHEPWVEGVLTVEDMPDYLRGPFSWKRLDEEGAA